MGLPDIGQLKDPIQLLGGEGHRRGIADQQFPSVALKNGLSHDGVVLVVLSHIGPGISPLVGGDALKGGHLYHGVGARAGVPGGEAGAPHVGDL